MTPLFILIPFVVAVSHGKPGGSYIYPSPTASAAPAFLSNLGSSVTPSVFNLQTPSVSLAPSIINLPAPSIAPSLLVENVLGAGQYGQPLGLQSFGDQSLNLGLWQSQIGWPWANQGLNFAQTGFNFGGLEVASPQLPPQLSATPAPEVSLPPAQLDIGPTVSSSSVKEPKVSIMEGVVRKHVYVHVPPEEFEVKSPPRQIRLPAPRKDYRIIFIKTPSPPPIAPVLPPVQEEKTIVYVLVKKPEEQPEIEIQTPPPTEPSKPEVYFLQYNTIRKESDIPVGPVSIGNRNGGDFKYNTIAKESDIPVGPVSIGNRNGDLQDNTITKENDIPVEPVSIGNRNGGDIQDNTITKESNMPVGPVSIDSRNGDDDAPIEDVTQASDPTVPNVKVEVSTTVDIDLNKASLDGGSALSLAVTGSPLDNMLRVSSTPPSKDDPPEEK